MTNNKPHWYPKNSAGRLMITSVPTVSREATIGDIKKMLSKQASNFETINYIYITDIDKKLLGIISVRELFNVSEDVKALTLSPKSLVTAHAHTDQERVALLSLRNSIKAVPVVSKTGEFLGVVTSDVILNILHSEGVEDVLRFAGLNTSDDPVKDLSRAGVVSHFKKRFPWLVVGLLGGFMAAFVVSFFESSLAEQLILVAFIPAVVYMADAVGSQTQMIFVRSLALDHIKMKSYVWREVRINLMLASALGILMYVISFVWVASPVVSFVLGLSIAVTILVSMIVAIGIPWFLQKVKQDPAIASGPPATVARDIVSLLVYFIIITLFI